MSRNPAEDRSSVLRFLQKFNDACLPSETGSLSGNAIRTEYPAEVIFLPVSALVLSFTKLWDLFYNPSSVHFIYNA